jgi:hypothetical protein
MLTESSFSGWKVSGAGALALVLLWFCPTAHAQDSAGAPAAGSDNLDEIGKKLANPVSNVWALFTEFDLNYQDGDINKGHDRAGSRMIFQPVMPFPLYGQGDNEWKLITRPTIPVVFSEPIPQGYDQFDNKGGLGDIQLPMVVSPPTGHWLTGAGVTWLLPTGSPDEFSRKQWGAGPTAIFGYANKTFTAVLFPQYFWGIGDRSDRHDEVPPNASYLNMLYAVIFNLPDAWQVGTNPTLTYDAKASAGNKWNVPVGVFAAKMLKLGGMPVKLQLGVEYSVVRQADYGQIAQIKLNVIPVIPALVQHPIFGGD